MSIHMLLLEKRPVYRCNRADGRYTFGVYISQIVQTFTVCFLRRCSLEPTPKVFLGTFIVCIAPLFGICFIACSSLVRRLQQLCLNGLELVHAFFVV